MGALIFWLTRHNGLSLKCSCNVVFYFVVSTNHTTEILAHFGESILYNMPCNITEKLVKKGFCLRSVLVTFSSYHITVMSSEIIMEPNVWWTFVKTCNTIQPTLKSSPVLSSKSANLSYRFHFLQRFKPKFMMYRNRQWTEKKPPMY